MIEPDSYKNSVPNQWCPGCPNYGILSALKKALAKLDRAPHEVCLVSGIGQAAKLPHYLRCNLFNGLHGRAIPAAIGIHVANPALDTIVVTGDGDCYGEGGNHLLHALRRNPDITVIVHNNRIYALTKGQASPTTPRGERTRLQFRGVELSPVNMLATAIVHGCTFVARGFAGEIDHLSSLFASAIAHRGLSLVEVFQPCITWGPHGLDWYRDKIKEIPETHDKTDRTSALQEALTEDGNIAIGVLFERPSTRLFGSEFRESVGNGALAELPPLEREAIQERLARYRP